MGQRISLRTSGSSDLEVLLGGLRHVAPWVVCFVAGPALTITFRSMWQRDPRFPTLLMAVASAALVALVYKLTHARRPFSKYFALGYTAAPLAMMTIVVGWGMNGIPNNPLFQVWAIGGPSMCVAWNIRFRSRNDDDMDIDIPRVKAITAGPVEDQASLDAARAKAEAAEAKRLAVQVNAGFKQLTAPTGKLKELTGTKIKITGATVWRTDAVLALPSGSEPKPVLAAAGAFASKFRVGPADVRLNPWPDDNSRVNLRVVWKNPLEGVIAWAGPCSVGKSIGAVGTDLSVYEDQHPGEMFLPFRKLKGGGTQQGSHLLIEGMNGSGKSTIVQLLIADWSTRPDVIVWGVDVAKGLQTLGCVAPALDWFATTKDKARALMRFVQLMIPERGSILAKHGFSNWTPEAYKKTGLPLHIIVVEEGAIIFEALGKAFPEVMMTARSVGVVLVGSIQRAQHEWMDVTARAQFSQVITCGVASDGDIFGMPDEMRDLGCAPERWGNKQSGMHYHSRPDVDIDRLITPLKGKYMTETALLEIAGSYGRGMASLPDELLNAVLLTAGNELGGAYQSRTSGSDLRRAAGMGVPGDPSVVADRAPSPPPSREQTQVRHAPPPAAPPAPPSPVTPSWVEDTPPARHPGGNGVVIPGHFGGERLGTPTQPVQDVDDSEFADPDEKTAGTQAGPAPTERVVHVKGSDGIERIVNPDGDEYELEDWDNEPGDNVDPDIAVPREPDDDENVGIDGQARGGAATSRPQPPNQVIDFDQYGEDDETPDLELGDAEAVFLRLLAAKGPNFVFRAADFYEELPTVSRSKGWMRTTVINWSKVGKWVEYINDPGGKNDGRYRTTAQITQVRAGGQGRLSA